MESLGPLNMAQDVIRCSLCKDIPAESSCNTCHVGLCDGCLPKHTKSEKPGKHDIVPFAAKNVEILPECKNHSDKECQIHCNQCNFAICSTCIASGSHKLHELIEIREKMKSMRESLTKTTTELETLVAEEYVRIKAETKTKLSQMQNEYHDLKKCIFDHGKLWHEELDVIISRFIREVEEMEKEDIETMTKQLEELEKILINIKKESEENNRILKSNNFIQMKNHISKHEDFHNVPARVELSPPTFSALEMDIERISKQFGTVTSTIKTEVSEYNIVMKNSLSSLSSVGQLLDAPIKVKTTDNGGYINSMTTMNSDQMWVCRNGSIDLEDAHGTTIETINILSGNYSDGLTVTQEGHLIYTVWRDRTVNIVRKGKTETVIKTGDWVPSRVCSTSSGDLLVCQQKDQQNRVVRYSSSKVIQEIRLDEKNKPLFTKGYFYLFVAENQDQAICVSDPNAKRVLVLNKEGKLKFRYDGNLVSETYKFFVPRGIATDSQCQILIADMDNHCIHIINCKGKFLKYIDICHLDKPTYISVDSSDQLFVSGSGSSSVQIIKYMK